jgi:DNA-directed RNA polymerase specialized sigma24 family protein
MTGGIGSGVLNGAAATPQFVGTTAATDADVEAVRRQCVFTTHTPVPAGHDRFPVDKVRHVLGAERVALLEAARCCDGGELNMTRLALRCSRYVNAVALRHRDVSREMFPEHPIHAITNGVHAMTWTSEPLRELFDRHLPGWRVDNAYLHNALSIPLDEIRAALAALRPEYRAVFVLFHEQGQPYDAIAGALQRPVGTVKTWLHRARLEVLERLRHRGMVPAQRPAPDGVSSAAAPRSEGKLS